MNEVWLDSREGIYFGERVLRNEDGSCRVRTVRLQGGPSDGVDRVTLEVPGTVVEVIPTRGMGIARIQCDGVQLKWNSPVEQIVHPRLVNLEARNGLGWLGGFNEFLCRCGLAWNGAPDADDDGWPLTLHGNIANRSAHRVEAGISPDGTVWVEGTVDECSLFGPRLRLTSRVSISPGRSSVEIDDRVVNLGGVASDFELLYHINFGAPLLSEGAHCVAPARRVIPRDAGAAAASGGWDRYQGPQAGFAEECYFLELAGSEAGRSEVLLVAHDGNSAAGVEFSLRDLPHFTVWKNTQAAEDGYCTGLEPSTDLPNARSFERQQERLQRLEPGETWSTMLRLNVYATAETANQAQNRIQDWVEQPPVVLDQPLATHTP